MKISRHRTLYRFAFIGLLYATPALAESEEPEKVRHARIEAALEESAKKVSDACGAKVAVKLDWKSFSAEDISRYSIDSFCSSPLDELVKLCRGAATKAHVKKTVTAYECSFGGTGKRSLGLQGSTIKMTVDFEAPNYDEFARKALVEKL